MKAQNRNARSVAIQDNIAVIGVATAEISGFAESVDALKSLFENEN